MPKPRKPASEPAGAAPAMVRTTFMLPEHLWHAAKVRAIEERTTLRDLLIEGLELRLQRGNVHGGNVK